MTGLDPAVDGVLRHPEMLGDVINGHPRFGGHPPRSGSSSTLRTDADYPDLALPTIPEKNREERLGQHPKVHLHYTPTNVS